MDGATQLFVNYLAYEHGIDADEKDIAWEGIEMFQSEIDYGLFSQEILKTLPDPLLLHTACYVDEFDQEWIFCIATETSLLTKWLHAICLRNGELIEGDVPLDLV